jgi:aryl sulfotransferase
MAGASRPVVARHYRSALMDSRRWESFKPRDGDIVISTSYKAGTTWLQGICAALVFQAPEPPVPQDELSPWLDALFAPLDVVLGSLEGLTNRRYIKTHLPLDGLIYHDRVKYLVVGRDGRDVFMSMWNHWNNMQPESIDRLNSAPDVAGPRLKHPPSDLRAAFDEWLSKGSFEWEQDGYPFWSHLHHARTWWEHRRLPNICHVHYSDLNVDLDGEMRRIAAYLDIPVNEAVWPDLVRAVTFEQMKANAGKLAPGATQGLWKDTADFFHQGTNRRWEGRLTPEQSNRYEELAASRLPPALARWLEAGRRVAGDPKEI